MKQITLRGLPPELEQAIRKRAAEEHKSINRTIRDLLQQALGVESSDDKRRDLSDLAGSWSDEDAQAFERATGIFDEIDEEVWR